MINIKHFSLVSAFSLLFLPLFSSPTSAVTCNNLSIDDCDRYEECRSGTSDSSCSQHDFNRPKCVNENGCAYNPTNDNCERAYLCKNKCGDTKCSVITDEQACDYSDACKLTPSETICSQYDFNKPKCNNESGCFYRDDRDWCVRNYVCVNVCASPPNPALPGGGEPGPTDPPPPPAECNKDNPTAWCGVPGSCGYGNYETPGEGYCSNPEDVICCLAPTEPPEPTNPPKPTDAPPPPPIIPTIPTAACNQPCKTNEQCSSHNPTHICAPSNNWSNVTPLIEQVGSGKVQSFSVFDHDGVKKQHMVKGDKIWYRDNSQGWSKWTDATKNTADVGSGTITSFKSVIVKKDVGTIQQYLVRGGKIWYRDNSQGWSKWTDITENVSKVGSGTITSFSTFLHPKNNFIIQHLVRGEEIWGRDNSNGWTEWKKHTSGVNSIGSGKIQSFQSQSIDGEVRQYFVRSNILYQRNSTGGTPVCRHSENLTSTTCEGNSSNPLDQDKDGDIDFLDLFKFINIQPPRIYDFAKLIHELGSLSPSPSYTPKPVDKACNSSCNQDTECSTDGSLICSSQQVWEDITSATSDQAVPDSSGQVTSFSIYQKGNIKERYLTKGGRLWLQSTQAPQWQDLTDADSFQVGSGPITSFHKYQDLDSGMKFHLVRDGKLYYMDDGIQKQWREKYEVAGAGSGPFQSFSVSFKTDGITKVQHLTRGGYIWTRSGKGSLEDIPWQKVTSDQLFGIGSGEVNSFTSQYIDNQTTQYFTRGKKIWQRIGDSEAKVCRLNSNPESNTCQSSN